MIAASSCSATAAASASGSFHGTTIVSAACALGHARARGDPLRGEAGAGLGEQPVDVAVVGAGELHDLVAAGGRARQAQRAHRRLGAGVDHPDHLHRRRSARRPRPPARPRPRSARRSSCPAAAASLHRLRRRRDARARGSAAPMSRPSRRSGCRRRRSSSAPSPALDEDRVVAADRAHRPHRRVDPARHEPDRACVEPRRRWWPRSRRGERAQRQPPPVSASHAA